jgi:putative ABC transport system ATP-binding protein
MASREPILEVEDLVKYYGAQGSITKALRGISMTIYNGEFVGVMGPSGSGKTTLLNVVSTIDTPTSGRVRVGGKELTGLKRGELARFRRERLGFIFQDFNLLDTLTLRENIALALSIAGAPGADEHQVAGIALRLGIEEALDKFPYQVSGGQKQRAAAARAIITSPDLILADEPTGSLDSRSAQMLLEAIDDLNHQLGATIMMVTHDPFAASYCQRILFIKDGQLFTELVRGGATRKQFFDQVMAVLALLGGAGGDVR